MCNTSLLTDIDGSSWYGFTGDSYGNNTLFSASNCSCSYTFEICETRRELSCSGTDVPYNSSDEDALCAVDDSDWSRFVGGGETDIVSYGGASINSTAETCSCSYEVDNCLDDVDYHDNFLKPINESLAICNISLLLPCCGDSELAFGGTKISELNLTSYLSLAEDDGNEWECYNGDDFCPSSMEDVPTISEYWFSWLYNEDDGANGFDGDSLCQCWVQYDNCTTDAPTMAPTQPTEDPTFSPTTDPTVDPTKMPSAAPSVGRCPNFDVTQPCCADDGGSEFVDFQYQIWNESAGAASDVFVPVEEEENCTAVYVDSTCCGSDFGTNLGWRTSFDSDGNVEYGCTSSEFEQYASDTDVWCDTSLLTNINTSSWYGFTGNSYVNFTIMEWSTGKCYCSYTFEICETRRELSCSGTDVPYNYSSDANALCAVDDSDWSRFVGGGETDIVSYGGASINSTAETCSCSYEVDNCLDDVDYHDNFLKPINESLAFCNISVLLPCCGDSELAFGGTKISELNLTSYLSLAEDDGNEWECYNGDDFCPSSMGNVPTISEYWFSWLYNEDDGANGFDGDSLCQCWVHSENCTTDAPTSPPTNNPTFVPTAMPTAEPSPSPTKYQFDDYDTASVVQLCCNNASITEFSDETCPDDSAPEDSFDGTSDSIEYDTYILNNGEYYCYFDVGHWNWSIPSAAGYAAIDDAIWPEMMSNVSWNWTMTDLEESDFTSSSSSRRRLVDLSCFDVLVTECDDSNACLVDNEPIASNWSFNNILIGDTFENFTHRGDVW